MAGNDAGHAFNSFPKMNGQWVPDEYFEFPGWRNAFESTAAVQLHHRCASHAMRSRPPSKPFWSAAPTLLACAVT